MSIINGFNTGDSGKTVNNYELITLTSQQDVSKPATAASIYGQISDISNSSQWTGYSVGHQDLATWQFSIETDSNYPLVLSSSTVSNSICAFGYVDGSNTDTIEGLNTALERGTSDGDTYIKFTVPTGACNVYMKWDLTEPKIVTIPGYLSFHQGSNTVEIQGSVAGSSWDTLVTLKYNTFSTELTTTTAYRYYRIKMSWANSSSYRSINMRAGKLSKIPDKICEYKNNFTVDNDFTKIQCKNIIVPEYNNANYITENTINGLSLNEILKIGKYYKLRYNGNNLEFNDNPVVIENVVTGTYTGNGKYGASNQNSLTFDFIPSLIEIQYTSIAATNGTTGNAMRLYPKESFGVSEYLSGNSSKRFRVYVSVSGTSVYWYTTETSMPLLQCNESGRVYRYWAYR